MRLTDPATLDRIKSDDPGGDLRAALETLSALEDTAGGDTGAVYYFEFDTKVGSPTLNTWVERAILRNASFSGCDLRGDGVCMGLTGTAGERIPLLLDHARHDGRHLLRRLAFRIDEFRHSLPRGAVMIQPGECFHFFKRKTVIGHDDDNASLLLPLRKPCKSSVT